MITEGILTEIDYVTNICYIRIPLLENVNSPDKVIVEGRFAIQPGELNGYKVDDLVWVGFVEGKLNQPLVLGKIYSQLPSTTNETNTSAKSLLVNTLKVIGDESEIPKTTKITGEAEFKTIDDLSNRLKLNTQLISQQTNIIKKLANKINELSGLLELAIVDLNGEPLSDINGEILTAKTPDEIEI